MRYQLPQEVSTTSSQKIVTAVRPLTLRLNLKPNSIFELDLKDGGLPSNFTILLDKVSEILEESQQTVSTGGAPIAEIEFQFWDDMRIGALPPATIP
ncbi:hypothetical protein CDL15_Pgr013340 [Punica granatum]|uniref:Uncharacterized protein n=1 Tax=Punica granatum TaxID=22663 RepID=A0A218WP59_PUNGR|nr:hypothetical protein CDL15_Pgr013340 [Punica granatum]